MFQSHFGGKQREIDLLLVLNLKRVSRQQHFDVIRDFLPRPLEQALENPDNLKDSYQADETWFLFSQAPLDDLRCAGDCFGSSCAR